MKGKCIAFEIEKGGSSKTTTVVNTAAILAEHGQKILVFDADSQGNCTKRSGLLPNDYVGFSANEVLNLSKSIKECIVKTKFGYDIIPSHEELQNIVVNLLMNNKKYDAPMYHLKNAIDEIRDKYDYILIDTPPTISFNTITTLLAADAVIIPMQCEEDAFEGAKAIIKAIFKYNPKIEIMGILPTMFNRNTNVSTDALSRARKFFNGKIRVFDTTIYRTVKFPEADRFRKPAVIYSDNEQVQNYREFVKEAFGIA
jgi:chromosome partitioning protein